MARKHTIFISALFHVAIAMFESDSSTPQISLPASSLEPLPCTSQLPMAAARSWQHLGKLSIPKIGMDASICTLSPLLIPSMGRSCCFSHVFMFPVETRDVRVWLCPFPLCRAGLSKALCSDTLLGLQHCSCLAQKLFQKAQLFWPENT